MQKLAIDILIPSYRPHLLAYASFLGLDTPPGTEVNFLVIIDNPSYGSLEFNHPEDGRLKFIVNSNNLGSSGARNVGIEVSTGDYIIFMDDDVVPDRNLLVHYVEAIRKHPDSAGFVGVTEFPAATNSFTSGIVMSDILTFFGIAMNHENVSWGTTSNLMIKRSEIGSARFDTLFPKSGGGEDIDFCLSLRSDSPLPLISVRNAVVRHGWWNNGKRQYRRFFRWAFGDSRLPEIFPRYAYLNFPNIIEFSVIAAISLGFLWWFTSVSLYSALVLALLTFTSEFFGELVRVRSTDKRMKVSWLIESILIRSANDAGRFCGNLRNGIRGHILKRFDYFTTGQTIRFERKIAGIKFMGFCLSFSFALLLK